MAAEDVSRAIDAVWRVEAARLFAGLARMVRDVGLAEDLAHDALVAALETWPASGIPGKPGAWLRTAARNRALDLLRRDGLLGRKHAELARELAEKRVPFEVPRGADLAPRLASVLEVIYLVFNEGYSATSGATGPAPRSARRRCGSGGSSQASRRSSPRSTASSR